MWSHKKIYKGKKFVGNYELHKDGSTKFHLRHKKITIRKKSYHVAKKDGWFKLKG